MKPIKICIVEDLKELREGLVNLLALDERFYMMEAFGDAETAAQQLPRWQPDIVIMDINLPGMNGIECIKKIKASLRGRNDRSNLTELFWEIASLRSQ